MVKIVRTNAENQNFIKLVKNLDAELAQRDGDDHAFYDQFNKIDQIKHVVVLYDNENPIGCGAIKEIELAITNAKRQP